MPVDKRKRDDTSNNEKHLIWLKTIWWKQYGGKGLHRSCFHVNYAKLLRTDFLYNTDRHMFSE